MANTYTLIASSTVGSGGASSIDFTSISATYTDLCLKLSLKNDRSYNFDNYYMQFNGDTASNYSSRLVYGLNGAAGSVNSATTYMENIYGAGGGSTVANVWGSAEVYIPNYAGSNQKSVSTDSASEGNTSADIILGLTAQKWSGTAAITSIKLYSVSGSFVQYSTAYLYGVNNA